MRLNLWVLLGLALCAVSIYDVQVNADVAPSEYECRPYIEKAINELKVADVPVLDSTESDEATIDQATASTTEQSLESPADGESGESNENSVEETPQTTEVDQKDDESSNENDSNESEATTPEQKDAAESDEQDTPAADQDGDSVESTENAVDQTSEDQTVEQNDDQDSNENSKENSSEQPETTAESTDKNGDSKEGDSKEGDSKENESVEEATAPTDNDSNESVENAGDSTTEQITETDNDSTESQEAEPAVDSKEDDSMEEQTPSAVEPESDTDSGESQEGGSAVDSKEDDSVEEVTPSVVEAEADDSTESQETEQTPDVDSKEDDSVEEAASSTPETENDSTESQEAEPATDSKEDESVETPKTAEDDSEESPKTLEEESDETPSTENVTEEKSRAKRSLPDEQEKDTNEEQSNETDEVQKDSEEANATEEESAESMPEEDLTMEFEIPTNLRDRSHINTLLRLDEEGSIKDAALQKTGDFILKDLKRIYDNAVKPLETQYKYRELSNRHFGDPEIFSKPLVLFMGPWSGGKSTILNYLTENEYTPNSVRSGAEPSPAYFNIMMYGDEPEVLDGTQLAADWTFSGLQKFGQGLNDRLRGHKLPNKLLSRINIVEIPGILEVRKQVSKVFPFNDACQWFIDRADIIILVYDPSKLDAGPETEAILDQLKGREYQTRILLNKADQVKPEELLRVQGALIWNISPLMSSAQPPVMYTVSLWSHPFENGAPIRLLQAQERAFLSDLHDAIDKRIENKIASARRFAVRIRNHAKMVDCYLTTYYNQKSLFSNKKHTADQIIENPHTYNIYEGLSTLTNISRYDLPDPEVYLDFFRLNPLWEFKKLSETCTYFKGCPIKKLDMAIAYDLPELVGRYKKLLEKNLTQLKAEHKGVCLENCSENKTEPEPSVKLSKHR